MYQIIHRLFGGRGQIRTQRNILITTTGDIGSNIVIDPLLLSDYIYAHGHRGMYFFT